MKIPCSRWLWPALVSVPAVFASFDLLLNSFSSEFPRFRIFLLFISSVLLYKNPSFFFLSVFSVSFALYNNWSSSPLLTWKWVFIPVRVWAQRNENIRPKETANMENIRERKFEKKHRTGLRLPAQVIR